MTSLLHHFLTPWGAFVLAALDSSLLFFAPFGTDVLLVYLAAREPERIWVFPLLTTAGSAVGAGVTYWIGLKIGEKGLPRFIPERRLERLKSRVNDAGAVAMALTGALPPPFPLTAFVLTSGALEVNPKRFFLAFTMARLVRFAVEALLARHYGTSILRVLRSDVFQGVMIAFVILAIAGTALAIVQVWRNSGQRAVRSRQ